MEPLSVVIITYNEEKSIGRCIDSVKSIADEVVVVDSFSVDTTVEIALSKGAMVKQLNFDGYISQKNKAIRLASHNYVLLLDADEALSEELAESIAAVKKNFSHAAYSMNRCSFFCGSFIRRGLWYPDKKLRLFDKRLGVCGGMNPHDRILLPDNAATHHLKGDLYHYSFDTLQEYLERNEQVSSIAAQSLYESGIKKTLAKQFLSPLWAFVNGYILKLGFLDGYKGWMIAVHTTKQSYNKYSKLRKLHRTKMGKIAWE